MKVTELHTDEEVSRVFSDLPSTVALDVETDSLNTRSAKLLSYSISKGGEAFVVPGHLVNHLHILKSRRLILQNFKYDFQVLHRHGVDLIDTDFRDTMLMHHLMDENLEHGLGEMVKTYFGDDYKEEFWSKYKTFEEAPHAEGIEYQGKDAVYTLKLYEYFSTYLKDKEPLVEHVHKLAKALYYTELEGVCVDVPLMTETKSVMGAEIASYIPKLRSEFDKQCTQWELVKWNEELDKRTTLKGKMNVPKPEFSFNSDAQLSWLIYKGLKLPVLNKTKKGNPSTDYETLETLSEQHPILSTLKSYKGAKTLYSTFVEGMLDRVEGGRIYPEFNINGTATGRISHKNPNLGNIPREGPIRGFFTPSPGCVLGGADYSQLEVVIEANFSKDKALRTMILEGSSKHDITAKGLGITRDAAKTLNFAMQYRCSPYKVASLLSVSPKEAQHVWDKYWQVYSGVKTLMDWCDSKLEAREPIVNPFGRARNFPADFDNKWDYEKAKRQAYNALIQGTGADITHKAFYRASERLRANGRGRMLWEVHDELLGEFKASLFEFEIHQLVGIMDSIGVELGFEIPLTAKPYGPFERWQKA